MNSSNTAEHADTFRLQAYCSQYLANNSFPPRPAEARPSKGLLPGATMAPPLPALQETSLLFSAFLCPAAWEA